jgi:autotransporter-associated beta strand protein
MAQIYKANNTSALNLPASWTGGVIPGRYDEAIWSLGANTVALGAANLDVGKITHQSTGNTIINNTAGYWINLYGINNGDGLGNVGIYQNSNNYIRILCELDILANQNWYVNSAYIDTGLLWNYGYAVNFYGGTWGGYSVNTGQALTINLMSGQLVPAANNAFGDGEIHVSKNGGETEISPNGTNFPVLNNKIYLYDSLKTNANLTTGNLRLGTKTIAVDGDYGFILTGSNNSNRAINVVKNTTFIPGDIAQYGSKIGLDKNGAGTLSLTGIGDFDGTVTTSAGTLSVGQYTLQKATLDWNGYGGAISWTTAGSYLGKLIGGTDFTPNTSLNIGSNTEDFYSGSFEFGGSILGGQAFTKVGYNTFTIYNTNTFSTRTGATTVAEGTLVAVYDDTLGQSATGGITIIDGGQLVFNNYYPPAKATSISGYGSTGQTTKYGSAGWVFYSDNLPYRYEYNVSSSITLTGDATITSRKDNLLLVGAGNITSNGYSLTLGDSYNPETSVYNLTGATYTINKIIALSSGSLFSNAESIIKLGAANTFTGFYENVGGTTILNNVSALSTPTLVGNTTIQFDTITNATIGGMFGFDGQINLQNSNGQAVSLTIGTSNTMAEAWFGVGADVYHSINSQITGQGSVIKTGTGELRMNNDQLYTGNTTVSQGTLTAITEACLEASATTSVSSGAILKLPTNKKYMKNLTTAANSKIIL